MKFKQKMKKVYNIFSNKKLEKKESIPKSPNPKIPIIIDTREKQSMVAANLMERKAKIKFEHLKISDYLIGEVAIERKTFSDFISSMINKRLLKQLQELKKYPKYFLIIENFDYDYYGSRIHENAIRGMFLSTILDFKVPIIFTEDEQDTASFLISVAKKQGKNKIESSLRPSKITQTSEEQKQFILEGFPGIGPATAKKLLKKFKNIKNIVNAKPEELKETLGKKAEVFINLTNN